VNVESLNALQNLDAIVKRSYSRAIFCAFKWPEGAPAGCHKHALDFEYEIREARLFHAKHFLSFWCHLTPTGKVTRPKVQPGFLDPQHLMIDSKQRS
jgi:hypothetical protein